MLPLVEQHLQEALIMRSTANVPLNGHALLAGTCPFDHARCYNQ